MKRIINGFLTALTTLSRIPIPWRFESDYSLLGFYLPLVGILAALPLWGMSFLIPFVSAPILIAVPGFFFQYWIFNLFHFDGLLDSADGLFYQGTPEKRLEILKDSKLGSYALFVGTLYLILKVALVVLLFDLMTGVPPLRRLFLLCLPAVVGRIACALVPLLLKSARPGGLHSLLLPYRITPVLAGIVAAGVLLFVGFVYSSAANLALELTISTVAALVTTVVIVALSFKIRIGGFTGDSLGAAVEVGELLCLAGVVLCCLS